MRWSGFCSDWLSANCQLDCDVTDQVGLRNLSFQIKRHLLARRRRTPFDHKPWNDGVRVKTFNRCAQDGVSVFFELHRVRSRHRTQRRTRCVHRVRLANADLFEHALGVVLGGRPREHVCVDVKVEVVAVGTRGVLLLDDEFDFFVVDALRQVVVPRVARTRACP